MFTLYTGTYNKEAILCIFNKKPTITGGWLFQMRENHSPLLQAAIRIGAAFKIANFGI